MSQVTEMFLRRSFVVPEFCTKMQDQLGAIFAAKLNDEKEGPALTEKITIDFIEDGDDSNLRRMQVQMNEDAARKIVGWYYGQHKKGIDEAVAEGGADAYNDGLSVALSHVFNASIDQVTVMAKQAELKESVALEAKAMIAARCKVDEAVRTGMTIVVEDRNRSSSATIIAKLDEKKSKHELKHYSPIGSKLPQVFVTVRRSPTVLSPISPSSLNFSSHSSSPSSVCSSRESGSGSWSGKEEDDSPKKRQHGDVQLPPIANLKLGST